MPRIQKEPLCTGTKLNKCIKQAFHIFRSQEIITSAGYRTHVWRMTFKVQKPKKTGKGQTMKNIERTEE